VYTRPRYAKFNTKKTTTTTTQQTENVMKNETKPLPISSSFKKDLPHLKCFIKKYSPKKFYHEKMNPYLVQIYYF